MAHNMTAMGVPQDEATDRLMAGLLQVADGTAIVLDESVLTSGKVRLIESESKAKAKLSHLGVCVCT